MYSFHLAGGLRRGEPGAGLVVHWPTATATVADVEASRPSPAGLAKTARNSVRAVRLSELV